ncbi:MAG TPA: hypothetical protein EYP71_02225 [Dehalococcoidia bacterium]|nr:hypothetical protein [Dehalococcoidia bacterium]
MGKKSRRRKGKHRPGGRLAKKTAVGPAPVRETVAPSKTVPPESVTSAIQASQYQYVLPELRRIGIIAGVLFLIVVIIAFILG